MDARKSSSKGWAFSTPAVAMSWLTAPSLGLLPPTVIVPLTPSVERFIVTVAIPQLTAPRAFPMGRFEILGDDAWSRTSFVGLG